MPRQTPLGTVRAAVKGEVRKSLNPASTQGDASINQVISDVQYWLASQYDWPFLDARWTIQVAPNSRYLPFPTQTDVGVNAGIDFERAGDLQFFIKWNNIWQEVYYGISEISEFNYIDSDLGQVLDPVQRWKFDDQGSFEIWPINASQQIVRFTGQRTPIPLFFVGQGPPPVWNDNALLDLDDLLVTYFATAEIAAREEQLAISKDLTIKGTNLMNQIRATYPKREQPPCIVGGGTTFDRRMLRIVPMVVVGGR